MSQSEARPLGLQRPQYHVFDTTIQIQTDPQSIRVNCAFPVKEIRITVSYTFATLTQPAFYYMTIPAMVPEAQVVAVMNKVAFYNTANASYLYSDGMNEANAIKFIFREPRMINGSYDIYITDALAQGAVVAGNAAIHIELLG